MGDLRKARRDLRRGMGDILRPAYQRRPRIKAMHSHFRGGNYGGAVNYCTGCRGTGWDRGPEPLDYITHKEGCPYWPRGGKPAEEQGDVGSD